MPEWTFPGRGRVQGQLQRASADPRRAGERLLAALPVRGRQAELGARLEERRAQAERALGYVELYGAYTETEAIFRVDRLLELSGSLVARTTGAADFDPAVIDWPSYVHDVHLPSVVEHARVQTTPGRREGAVPPATGACAAVLAPERQLAVFDLENTLIASNVVES